MEKLLEILAEIEATQDEVNKRLDIVNAKIDKIMTKDKQIEILDDLFLGEDND